MPEKSPPHPRGRIKLFAPILAGATLGDRLSACFGALIGIGLTAMLCGIAFGHGPHLPLLPLLVAPMGASAVLLFAVPASPLAQPWSIIGGNTISAFVGVAVARIIPDPITAAAVGVALAILAMSLLRCIHPPGGAAALTAVLGGPTVVAAGFWFALIPVGLNSAILVLCGWLYHKASRRHAYPHWLPPARTNKHGTSDIPSFERVGFRAEDVDRALEDLGETFDIDRADVHRLLHKVELHALGRRRGALTCADIMSRDIIYINTDAPLGAAQNLLIEHSVRTLPVVDNEGAVVGTVGLRELVVPGDRVAAVMSPPWTARPERPILDLVEPLTTGQTHAIVVQDDKGRLVGLVTQSDLLASLAAAELPGQNDIHFANNALKA